MSEQKYCPDTNLVWAILCIWFVVREPISALANAQPFCTHLSIVHLIIYYRVIAKLHFFSYMSTQTHRLSVVIHYI